MDEKTLKARFMRFALSIVRLTTKFPKETVYFVITNQIIRASSGAAANYRAACRGRTKPDFINKLGVVEEETDEAIFWLEFTLGVDAKWQPDITPIEREGNELLSIIVASLKTSKLRYRK